MRSAAPSPAGVGPRRDPQLAHPVAEAMPVGRHGRPQQHAVDDGVVGFVRGDGRRRHDRQPDRSLARPPAAGLGHGPDAGVVPEDDRLDPPVEDVGERLGRRRRAPGAGRRPAAPARAAARRAGPRRPAGRLVGWSASAGGRARAATSPGRALDVAERVERPPTSRPTGRSAAPAGAARPRRRARPARGCAPRSSARGGSPAPTRIALDVVVEQQPRHRERIGRLGARPGRPPAAPAGRRHEPGQRPFGTGHDREPARPPAADLEARQRVARRVRRARGRRRRPGRPRRSAADQQVDRRVRGRHRPGWRGCR